MKRSIINLIDDMKMQNLAKEMNNYGCIEDLSIDIKDHHYLMQAHFNSFDIENDVTVEFSDEKLIDFRCTCLWQGKMCPHVATSLVKASSLQGDLPINYHSSIIEERKDARESFKKKRYQRQLKMMSEASRELISHYKENYNQRINARFQNTKYELEPSIALDNENNISIQYRIGNEKKYIVKNLTSLLTRIYNQEDYSYGKALHFIHNRDSFDDKALKQIELIEYVYNIYDHLNKNNYYNYKDYKLIRYLPINEQFIDKIYETYKDEEYTNFKCLPSNQELSIHIKDYEEYYKLDFNFEYMHLVGLSHFHYLIMEDNFYYLYRIELDEDGLCTDLLRHLEEEEMIILKEDFPQFYKYVLTPLLDYINISYDQKIIEHQYNNIKLYGDIDDEQYVEFELYYVDDRNNRVKGFDEKRITTYKQDIVEQYIKKYSDKIDHHKAYFSLDQQETYEFLNDGLEFLGEYADVYVSEALKRVGKASHYNITVGVRINHNLLELDLESDSIPKNELKDVLNQYKRKKKFYRLKNGDLLYLNSPELEELSDFMDEYHLDHKDIKSGKIKMNTQRMFSVDEDANNSEYIKIDRKASFTKELDRFNSISLKDYPIPAHYENILRDYQKEGYVYLRQLNEYGFNGILADDMGLGKTLQVIALLDSIDNQTSNLVVAPASLIYNWEDEVHKFSDTLSVKCITGTPEERKEIITNDRSKLQITSYDYMRRDYELYKDKEFNYVILDEAQNIKNQKTKNAMSVKTLKASHKLALTGTPIENSLAELWSIFDFLMPNYLFNYNYFKKRYESDIVKNKDEQKITDLKKLVAPFILRRNKKDVLTELPDKIETTKVVKFNEEESNLYYANLAQANEELQGLLNMEKVDQIAILALLTRLRQICCEPRVLYENIKNPSSKMKATVDIIINCKENNQKVLLFSSFTSVLDLLEEELNLQGISYYKLTGSTKKEARRNMVMEFQNDDTDVFLISLKAGGTGLNLTAASTVIHYDPWWNMSAKNQATDRAYRIGQNKNVQVYSMVMKDSIEEKIVQLQEKKKELADLFVENNDVSLSQLSKDEILDLFTME